MESSIQPSEAAARALRWVGVEVRSHAFEVSEVEGMSAVSFQHTGKDEVP